MSEDDEDYDELPPITVNSSARDSRSFAMPCASEVASQRARAERCELELVRLREEHALAHSDSSGSEGEAALAAAVTALAVRAAAGAGAGARAPPPLAALLAPLAGPGSFLAEYARAARGAAPARAAALAAHTLRHATCAVEAAARAGAALADEEAAGAGAWLCLALAAREGRRLGPGLARAAHLLLDEVATEAQAAALVPALLLAVEEPRARLELADAVHGGGARAGSVSAAVVRATLADLLPAGAAEAARAWRDLPPPAQYSALQLAARARTLSPAHETLLTSLVTAPLPARDQRPDTLKVLVAASKLQVLFHVKK